VNKLLPRHLNVFLLGYLRPRRGESRVVAMIVTIGWPGPTRRSAWRAGALVRGGDGRNALREALRLVRAPVRALARWRGSQRRVADAGIEALVVRVGLPASQREAGASSTSPPPPASRDDLVASGGAGWRELECLSGIPARRPPRRCRTSAPRQE